MKELIGSWTLVSLCDVENGEVSERPYSIEGRLLYTKNRVYVGIGYHKPSGYTSNFYSGTYELCEEQTVKHHVEVSSDINRNNTTLVRQYELIDNELHLKGLNNIGKSVHLIWTKET